MPITAKELKERKAPIAEKLHEVSQKAAGEDRGLTDDEKKEWESLKVAAKRLDEQIALVEEAEGFCTNLAQPETRVQPVLVAATKDDAGHEKTGEIRPLHGQLRSFRGPKAEENAYRSGRWIFGALFGHPQSRQWCAEHNIDLRAHSEGVNTKGGALVIPEFERAIIDIRREYGVFRQNARVVPMAGDTLTVPRRLTGLTAYYVGEEASITESNKTWGQVNLTARKLACLSKYSSELAEDAIISVADDLAQEMAYAFAYNEDLAGFLGTGTLATYGGIVGLITRCTAATATVYTAIAGNLAFSTLDLADFENMIGQLPMFAGIRPKWFISKPAWAASMMRLADSSGGVTRTEVQQGGTELLFLGYPVVLNNITNSTLTANTSAAGGLFFGDLSMAATMGDRRGIRVQVLSELYAANDQLGIIGTERFDIVVHDVGDTSSAGCVIQLTFPGA